MRAYIKKRPSNFNHPEDMEKILAYLNEHGKLQVTDETVERCYYDFSDYHCAGWLCVNEENLEKFAEYMDELEI